VLCERVTDRRYALRYSCTMASIKTLCKATAWLDRPVKSVPTKWFGRSALPQARAQLGDHARKCAEIDWCGLRCATAVGVTRGIVHKVAIVLASPRDSTSNLLDTVIECVERHLGSHPTTAIDGLLIFDGEDGNVVVQEMPDSAPAQVLVYATSTTAATLGAADQK
jgi:uncharacterized metal-binding protein